MRRYSVRRAAQVVVAAVLFPGAAAAQTDAGVAALAASAAPAADPGRIVGRVVDGTTGVGLSGATVQVAGTALGSQSGVDGRFAVHNVPAGTVSITARRLGYQPKTVTGVIVVAGAAVTQDIALAEATVELGAVTVTASAERGSVSRAVDAQRAAVNVTSTISAEQIARGPDGDAASAAQRVSGVTVQDGRYVFVRGLGERYTVATLNGARLPSPEPERKMVPLDLFPSGALQTITTAKTFTPNLPGDFSGAQVDIRTREYPTTRQFTSSVSSSYNTAVTGARLPMGPRAGSEWLAAGAGPRAIPWVVQQTTRPQPGAQTNAMVNAMRNAWSTRDGTGGLGQSVSTSVGGTDDVFGRSMGYLVSTSYAAGDEAQVGTVRENVEGDRYEGALGRTSVLVGGLLNLGTMVGSHSLLSLNTTYNRTADNEARREIGFYENHGTNIRIERLRYVERTVRHAQLTGQHQVTPAQRVDWSLSSSGVSRQEPDRSEYVTWLDPATPIWYNQEGAFRAYGGLTERSLEASADYHLHFTPSQRHLLRVGGFVRGTNRDAFDAGYSIRSREWAPDDARWQMSPEEFFDGRFATNGETLFEMGIYNAGGNYRAEDRIVAGYSMVELGLTQRLRFIGGGRLERSAVEVSYEDVLGNRGVAAPSYTDVLPAAMLVLDVGATQKLRFSATQTLARPEYREIAPICYRAGLGEEQRCGNPELRRTLIRNYDFRWEHYPGTAETFSIALFAKRFADPIEPRYQGRSGTNSLWFENAERAVNYGIEVEAMRNLGALSERLEPFSAFANATVMRSEVHTGAEGDPVRPMTGQAPYVFNAGVTWHASRSDASATVLYNVVGERIVNARPSGQLVSDVVEMPRPGLDLSVRFPMPGTLSGKVDFKNLLDAPFEVRQGDLLRTYHRSGRSVSVGFTVR